jgi:hypothetical protein
MGFGAFNRLPLVASERPTEDRRLSHDACQSLSTTVVDRTRGACILA